MVLYKNHYGTKVGDKPESFKHINCENMFILECLCLTRLCCLRKIVFCHNPQKDHNREYYPIDRRNIWIIKKKQFRIYLSYTYVFIMHCPYGKLKKKYQEKKQVIYQSLNLVHYILNILWKIQPLKSVDLYWSHCKQMSV